ncbi:hypothetical protein V7S57_22465 [Caulobacter sp. CCNWLY153]|uniref:Uncharacterized protein n=1 Tax=Caulobacter radicis TaxID=2172650 RepID=A0A2T9JVR6_9CAUL|nr:hypothetical protein [Caulobacter radicis]PVM87774.1 hypothetical protein DDF65_02250 [Caulobacter radicis]
MSQQRDPSTTKPLSAAQQAFGLLLEQQQRECRSGNALVGADAEAFLDALVERVEAHHARVSRKLSK